MEKKKKIADNYNSANNLGFGGDLVQITLPQICFASMR